MLSRALQLEELVGLVHPFRGAAVVTTDVVADRARGQRVALLA